MEELNIILLVAGIVFLIIGIILLIVFKNQNKSLAFPIVLMVLGVGGIVISIVLKSGKKSGGGNGGCTTCKTCGFKCGHNGTCTYVDATTFKCTNCDKGWLGQHCDEQNSNPPTPDHTTPTPYCNDGQYESSACNCNKGEMKCGTAIPGHGGVTRCVPKSWECCDPIGSGFGEHSAYCPTKNQCVKTTGYNVPDDGCPGLPATGIHAWGLGEGCGQVNGTGPCYPYATG